jgi:hypothetical protein
MTSKRSISGAPLREKDKEEGAYVLRIGNSISQNVANADIAAFSGEKRPSSPIKTTE